MAFVNLCSRCGKERILEKEWEEDLETFRGTTRIKHTQTVCPDVECQKIIDQKTLELKQKIEEQKKGREERIKNLLEQRALNKKANLAASSTS